MYKRSQTTGLNTILAVKNFLNGVDRFKVVFCRDNTINNTNPKLITPITNDILVLDSSFNPPHLGHQSMLEIAPAIYNKNIDLAPGTVTTKDLSTHSGLLLLSIKNADKGDVSTEEYAERLDMMILLAQKTYLTCAVALTKESLFINKSKLITEWLKIESPNKHIDNYFLLGFDTITRFFDLKYYQNKSIIESLNPFFENSHIIALLREDNSLSGMNISQQMEYLDKIIKNQTLNGLKLPDLWNNKIIYGECKDTWNMSSSKIRQNVKNDVIDWKAMVLPEVADYIEKKGMYK